MQIVIDIETLPDQSANAKDRIAENVKHPAAMKKGETIADWHNGTGKYAGAKEIEINNQYLKTSFDGGRGRIACICIELIDTGETFKYFGENEAAILESFWCSVRSNTELPYFIAHNAKFDLPFLWHRSVVNDANPGVTFNPHGRHGSNHFCTMEAWAGFNGRISLNNLADILGEGSKTEGMDGSQVWPEYQKGNIDKIVGYCADDVALTSRIYKRLKFM